MIKIGSDFSGVGALIQALRRLKISYKEIFACDWDKYSRKTYIENYGEPDFFPKDVHDRFIPVESLDLYMTSPSCQPFSFAGKRKGEEDERGQLFYNSHNFIKINKPRFFIFENVKGLLSDDKKNKTDKIGRTFRRWLDFLGGKSLNGNKMLFPHEESLPYHIYYKVLNAKNYGVPQNRERVFIIGIRDDIDNKYTWPKPFHLNKRLKDILETNVHEKYYLSDRLIVTLRKKAKGFEGIFNPHDENSIYSNCLTARYHKMARTDPFIKIGAIRGRNPENPKSRQSGLETIQTLEINENNTSNAITTVQKDNVVVTDKIRRLTPRECFRLMDFPDSFKWTVSDTQAYKQAGNSIVVECLSQIINKLNF